MIAGENTYLHKGRKSIGNENYKDKSIIFLKSLQKITDSSNKNNKIDCL